MEKASDLTMTATTSRTADSGARILRGAGQTLDPISSGQKI